MSTAHFSNWQVVPSEPGAAVTIRDGDGPIAHVLPTGEGREIIHKRARLIAAAPDMLTALKALFEHCAMVHKHWGDGCNQRQADAAQAAALLAIAKAEGRKEGPTKYEAERQPGLFFWAEANELGGGDRTFGVVSQMEGFPPTEAHDDWFANHKDADEVARKLAKEYDPGQVASNADSSTEGRS